MNDKLSLILCKNAQNVKSRFKVSSLIVLIRREKVIEKKNL